MKTLQQCKDDVAKKHGFDNFHECYVMGLETSTEVLLTYMEQAAIMYAHEACREQRDICANEYYESSSNFSTKVERAIENAPEPTLS